MSPSPSPRVVAVIQARTGSTRLPRKVLLDLWGQPVVERVWRQTSRSRAVHQVFVATSTLAEDDAVEWTCDRIGAMCLRGSATDVRSRYTAAAAHARADILVRVTADNPLTEPRFIDLLVTELIAHEDWDYCTMDAALIPHGTGSEAFRVAAFLETAARDESDYAREHVTPCLKTQRTVHPVRPPEDLLLSNFNVSIDTPADYHHVAALFARYRAAPDLLRRLVADVRAGAAGLPDVALSVG